MAGSGDTAKVTEWLERVTKAADAGELARSAVANIERWLTSPQYCAYLPAIGRLIDGGDWKRLDRLFWEVIPFGTGGRRGLMAEFGSATINERTIAESAWGLGEWMRKSKGSPRGKAVVAHDSRNRSAEFARLTASVLCAQGLQVSLFEGNRSTPELSFAVRHLGCDVGVMVSASHNPPSDNGFKAYWSHGGQVLSPHDKGIIECVYAAADIPMANYVDAVRDGGIVEIGEEIDNAYIEAVAALSLSKARDMRAIFTPLHGVGETSVYRILKRVGFDKVEIFEPQRKPDGNFTNVPDQLPNPERTQVFHPAMEQAKASGIDLILASDPDADRLGVMVRGKDGAFVHLTGNRVGSLVVAYILAKRKQAGTLSPEHYVVETLVTTPLISTIAKSYGVRSIDNLLVGFKYIGETMDREGPDKFVFGAEESLGYLAGEYARDKDAAVAALYIMELAAELKANGQTLLERLDELFAKHGYFVEGQKSLECTGSKGRQQIDAIMQALRTSPPKSVGGLPLLRALDYVAHEVRTLPANTRTADLPHPKGDLVFFEAGDPSCLIRFAVRPSGTEPKIKFYFFGQAPVSDASALAGTKARTDALMKKAMDDLNAWAGAITV